MPVNVFPSQHYIRIGLISIRWITSPEQNNIFSLCSQYRTCLWPYGANRSGVGVTKPISSVPLFPKFSALLKNTLTVKYRVYIWQVSPQLSCGDTCQIWMWFEESNMYFCEIENFAYGEINERSFSNPHPRAKWSASITASGSITVRWIPKYSQEISQI